MNMFNRLGLVGMLLHEQTRSKISWDLNPQLMGYLELLGIRSITTASLVEDLQRTVGAIEREFDYFDASEMKTNEVLSQYLLDCANIIKEGHPLPRRDVAMVLCSLGNKGGAFEEDEGVEALLKVSTYILEELEAVQENNIPDFAPDIYVAWAHKLEKLHAVLSLLDVFLTSRLGMLQGVEEFAPLDYNYLNPVDPPDLVSGLECTTQDDCQCGCAFDHPLRILQGMEDFLNGSETEDAEYFQSVARTNNIRLDLYAGQEGPVYEAIKELGSKAYDAVMAAWKSVSEWFNSAKEAEVDSALKQEVEDNKKAIQSMPTQGVTINDAAKNGLHNLAERSDPSGAMTKIVDQLKSPGDASRVLDGLLGLMSKQTAIGGPLFDSKKAAETALAELKKSSQAVNGNDENKEAAGEAKALVKEKIKGARDSVKAAKKLVAQHNKITSGIKKAISGITPHIFIVSKDTPASGDQKGVENNQGGKKKGGKKK